MVLKTVTSLKSDQAPGFCFEAGAKIKFLRATNCAYHGKAGMRLLAAVSATRWGYDSSCIKAKRAAPMVIYRPSPSAARSRYEAAGRAIPAQDRMAYFGIKKQVACKLFNAAARVSAIVGVAWC